MPVKFRDYYQTLDVEKTASPEEIKSAFRKLARKYHPDVATNKGEAEEKFKEINEAYEVLSDPQKRSKYDAVGPDWERMQGASPRGEWSGGTPEGGARWETSWEGGMPEGVEFEFGGTGFSDFFEHLFGTRRTQRGRSGQAGFGTEFSARGQDIESDILVTLEEALHGSTRQVSFRRSPRSKVETYTVKIPKGVREGQRIRLAGIGGAGMGGGAAGDLYLRVKYERHPEFEFEGADVTHEAEVPVWKAVLGAEISVPTLDGVAKLKIPTGAQQGQRLRLAGKGLPKPGGTRGDFFVVLRAVLPSGPLTTEERSLWQKIADFHGAQA